MPDKLAVFGANPLFSEKLYVNRPNVGNQEDFIHRVESMLDRRWFTNGGPFVEEFEQRLASYLDVKNCVTTCNGTMALQLIIMALGLKGEVIIPSFTFIATAHALMCQGITPVFCDIDINTWNIDPIACEALITDNTSAIVGVHLWGRPCDTEKLDIIASRYNLPLFFDAAHAFGCSHQTKMIGRNGYAEAFSFHATKAFHTFEGGAVSTNDDQLAEKIRKLSNFGFSDYDSVDSLGTNAKMSEVSAAMGLTNLEALESNINKNKCNYQAYCSELYDIIGLKIINYDENEHQNYQYVVVDVDEDLIGLSRDQLIQILHAENVYARRYFYPGCHRMEPYVSQFKAIDIRLPVTNYLAKRVMVLPAGAEIKLTQIKKICTFLTRVINQSTNIRKALDNL